MERSPPPQASDVRHEDGAANPTTDGAAAAPPAPAAPLSTLASSDRPGGVHETIALLGSVLNERDLLRSQNDELWKCIETQRSIIQQLQRELRSVREENKALRSERDAGNKEPVGAAEESSAPSAQPQPAYASPPPSAPQTPPSSAVGGALGDEDRPNQLPSPSPSSARGEPSPDVLSMYSPQHEGSSPTAATDTQPDARPEPSSPAPAESKRSSAPSNGEPAGSPTPDLAGPSPAPASSRDGDEKAADATSDKEGAPSSPQHVDEPEFVRAGSPDVGPAPEQSPAEAQTSSVRAAQNRPRDLPVSPAAQLENLTVRVIGSTIKTREQGREEMGCTFSLCMGGGERPTEMCRIEKCYSDLLAFDAHMKQLIPLLAAGGQLAGVTTPLTKKRFPEKALLHDCAPSKVAQRKAALEDYLRWVLSIPACCNDPTVKQFFSTGRIPFERPVFGGDGYLAKRGKSFGKWKLRYFVINGPYLEYYDTKGSALREGKGSALRGSIYLKGCRIGLPQASEGKDDSKHTFVIMEPKRVGDPKTTYTKHALGADSDDARDEWVGCLATAMFEGKTSTTKLSLGSQSDPSAEREPVLPRPSLTQERSAVAPKPLSLRLSRMSSGSSRRSRLTVGSPAAAPSAPGTPSDFFGGSHGHESESASIASQTTIERPDSADSIPAQRAAQPPQFRTRLDGPVFGVSLQTAVKRSAVRPGYPLPAVVHRCIEYLEAKKAHREEGIYRLSGSNAVIRDLKDRFNVEGDVDLLAEQNDYDVHAVAGLLKMYLRELPANILTPELHTRFLEVMGLDRTERVTGLAGLISKLPPANYTLLRALIAHLTTIVSHASENKMTRRNVGIVFSPTLGIPAGGFTLLMSEFEYLFAVDGGDGERGKARPTTLAIPNVAGLRQSGLGVENGRGSESRAHVRRSLSGKSAGASAYFEKKRRAAAAVAEAASPAAAQSQGVPAGAAPDDSGAAAAAASESRKKESRQESAVAVPHIAVSIPSATVEVVLVEPGATSPSNGGATAGFAPQPSAGGLQGSAPASGITPSPLGDFEKLLSLYDDISLSLTPDVDISLSMTPDVEALDAPGAASPMEAVPPLTLAVRNVTVTAASGSGPAGYFTPLSGSSPTHAPPSARALDPDASAAAPA